MASSGLGFFVGK